MTLGTLKEVENLREVWANEVHDFTPWLSDNIGRLGEALGIDITVEETESSVGDFNVDIYARDADTDRRIIIENQLEDTDHDHLGKLITYASGKDAAIVVWVVKRARDEHRAAIEWLNSHTDEDIGFFLCEIKLYQIGDSDIAPHFNVIERPNNWAKEMRTSSVGNAKRKLPRIADMLSWGIVKAGDILITNGSDDEAVLQRNGHVTIDGEEMAIHTWLQNVTGWSSVETYKYARHKETGKTLSELRREYMESHNGQE